MILRKGNPSREQDIEENIRVGRLFVVFCKNVNVNRPAVIIEMPCHDKAITAIISGTTENLDRNPFTIQIHQQIGTTASRIFHEYDTGNTVPFDRPTIDFADLFTSESEWKHLVAGKKPELSRRFQDSVDVLSDFADSGPHTELNIRGTTGVSSIIYHAHPACEFSLGFNFHVPR